MDDGIVEDVVEENLVPATEGFSIFNLLGSVTGFFEAYGWFILIGAVVAYLLYNKFKEKLSSGSASSFIPGQAYARVNEDDALERMRRIEAVRARQQAAVDAAAAKYLEEKKLKEEKAAQEKAEEWEKLQKGLGYHNKTKRPEDNDLTQLGLSNPNKTQNKSRLRDSDYNPLMGAGGGSGACFRPARRGGGGARGG